jgi:hypothetical protein
MIMQAGGKAAGVSRAKILTACKTLIATGGLRSDYNSFN